MILFLTITLLLSLQSQWLNLDKSVFGIPLGEKFVIPECERRRLANGDLLPIQNVTAVCFDRSGREVFKSLAPVTDGEVYIRFPLDKRPLMTRGISGVLVAGNLESIEFSTGGYSTQDNVLDELKKKYGEPSSLSKVTKLNQMGASFSSYLAVWNLGELTVEFQGMTDTVDRGLVNVDTKIGLVAREASLKKSHEGRPAL